MYAKFDIMHTTGSPHLAGNPTQLQGRVMLWSAKACTTVLPPCRHDWDEAHIQLWQKCFDNIIYSRHGVHAQHSLFQPSYCMHSIISKRRYVINNTTAGNGWGLIMNAAPGDLTCVPGRFCHVYVLRSSTSITICLVLIVQTSVHVVCRSWPRWNLQSQSTSKRGDLCGAATSWP